MAGVCLVVVCITLSLGLWPFHSPRNEVRWIPQGGLEFGKYGTVIGSGMLKPGSSSSGPGGSIEIWALPDRRNSATILSLYRPEEHLLVTLNQSITDLEVAAEFEDSPWPKREWHFFAGEAFGPAIVQKRPVFITVTSSPAATKVYLDGKLVETTSRLFIPQAAFGGRLIVGDSPRQPNSFSGNLLGLAIYGGELDGDQVAKHYQSWVLHGRPGIEPEPRPVALYLFNEQAGDVAHSEIQADNDLYIPPRYMVLDKILLEPIWKEFSFSGGYWSGNLKNVVGFVPLGFSFFALFSSMWPERPAATVTVGCGVLVSLTIELLQGPLPTRDSGTTDIVTNAFGAWLGVVCYRDVYLGLVRRFPWLGWFVPTNPSQGTFA